MQIAVLKDFCCAFEGEQYIVDLDRKFGGYEKGDLLCEVNPFGIGLPLTLDIAIRADGSLIFRKWAFNGKGNHYLHTHEKSKGECDMAGGVSEPFIPTEQQIDTVNGLFREE